MCEAPGDEHISILVEHHGSRLAIGTGPGIKVTVQSAIGVQPGDIAGRYPVQDRKGSAQHDLAVVLDRHCQNRIPIRYPSAALERRIPVQERNESRICTSVGIEANGENTNGPFKRWQAAGNSISEAAAE